MPTEQESFWKKRDREVREKKHREAVEEAEALAGEEERKRQRAERAAEQAKRTVRAVQEERDEMQATAQNQIDSLQEQLWEEQDTAWILRSALQRLFDAGMKGTHSDIEEQQAEEWLNALDQAVTALENK